MMQILSNCWMDEEATIQERRRTNLKAWMAVNCGGKVSKLMKAAGREGSATHLQGVVNGDKPFGEKLARALERELNLDEGSLDKPVKSVEKKAAAEWLPFITRAEYELLQPHHRQRIRDAVRGMLMAFTNDLPDDGIRKKKRAGTDQGNP